MDGARGPSTHFSCIFITSSNPIWSPLEQFRGLTNGQIYCPKCDHNTAAVLRPRGWRDGTKGDRSEPRKIYGSIGVTHLVGRVYECTNMKYFLIIQV